jgi:branched-chain amino acid transport system permease protein
MQQFLQLLVGAIAVGCIYAMIALSFELAYEATGVVNFATGQLVVVGALIGATSLGLSGGSQIAAYAAMLAGTAVLGAFFFLAGYWPLRRQPIVTIIIGTMAISMLIQNVALLVWGSLPIAVASPAGAGIAAVGGIVVPHHAAYVVAVTLVLIAGVYVLLYRSTFGMQIRALAQDPDTARLMGIRVGRSLALTWVLVTVLAGAAGVLLAPMWFVDVSLGDSLALKAFAASVVGGFGSIPGAICGGILVGLTEILGAAYLSSHYKDAIVFLLMIAFLIVRPQGLFGERIADRA